MIWGLLIGIVLGFFFKPQIEGLIRKASRYIKDKRNQDKDY